MWPASDALVALGEVEPLVAVPVLEPLLLLLEVDEPEPEPDELEEEEEEEDDEILRVVRD